MLSFKYLMGAAATALVMSMGSAATAGTLFYKQDLFDGDTTTGDTFNGLGKVKVRIEGGPRTPITAHAGGFALTDTVNDIIAWCLDIEHDLSIPKTGRLYTETDTPFTDTIGSIASKTGQIRKLFNTAYATLDLTKNVESAGFQLALWEILYETADTLSLSDGAFQQTLGGGGPIGASAKANQYLAGLDGTPTQWFTLTFLESAKDANGVQLSQNLVTAAVPLPASVLLLGLGVAGLAGMRRRRKA